MRDLLIKKDFREKGCFILKDKDNKCIKYSLYSLKPSDLTMDYKVVETYYSKYTISFFYSTLLETDYSKGIINDIKEYKREHGILSSELMESIRLGYNGVDSFLGSEINIFV